MPKQKTHKGAAKRFRPTKSGKVKQAHGFKRHILVKKPTKRTRNLLRAAYLTTTEGKTIKKLILYKRRSGPKGSDDVPPF